MPELAENIELDHVTFLSGSVAAMDQDDFIATKSVPVYGVKLGREEVARRLKNGYSLDPAEFGEDSGVAFAVKNDYVNAVSSQENGHVHGIWLGMQNGDGGIYFDVRFAQDPDNPNDDGHYHMVTRDENGDYLLIENLGHTHVISGDAVRSWLQRRIDAEGLKFDIEALLSKPLIKQGDNPMPDTYAPLSEAGIKFLVGKSEEEQKQFKAMTPEQRDEAMLKAAKPEDDAEPETKEETTPEVETKAEESDMVTIGEKQYKRSELSEETLAAVKLAEEAEEKRKAESARITRLEEQRKADQIAADVKEFMGGLSLDEAVKAELMGLVMDTKSAKTIKEFFKSTGVAIKAAKEGPIAHAGATDAEIGAKLEKAGIRSKTDLANEIDRVKREEILPELQKQDRFKNREVKDFNIKAEFETNDRYKWLRDAERDLPDA